MDLCQCTLLACFPCPSLIHTGEVSEGQGKVQSTAKVGKALYGVGERRRTGFYHGLLVLLQHTRLAGLRSQFRSQQLLLQALFPAPEAVPPVGPVCLPRF